MKKNFNVIQINGFRGLLMAFGVVACLFAGFIVFPGFVMKSVWNIISCYTGVIPQIAMLQGVLLWAIVVIGYFAFRKNKMMIEFKSANDLSRDEMEEVMQRIRIQRQADIISRAMMEARKEFDAEKTDINNEHHIKEEEKNHIDI